MDFSSSVQFGFEKNRGFGSALKNRRFGFLCRSVVKYKKKHVSCLSCVCILHFGQRFSKCSIGLKRKYYRTVSTDNLISCSFTARQCS